MHLTHGTVWINGLAIGDIDADQSGNENGHATLSVTNGTIYDEDVRHNISDGNPQQLSSTAYIPVYYKTGANGY